MPRSQLKSRCCITFTGRTRRRPVLSQVTIGPGSGQGSTPKGHGKRPGAVQRPQWTQSRQRPAIRHDRFRDRMASRPMADLGRERQSGGVPCRDGPERGDSNACVQRCSVQRCSVRLPTRAGYDRAASTAAHLAPGADRWRFRRRRPLVGDKPPDARLWRRRRFRHW
jgi:hypothetical protein